MRRLVILAAMLLASISIGAGAATAKQIALVVGNSSYQAAGALKNPVNDARAMAQALRARGFEVILRENAGKVAFERAIQEFGEKLNEGATGLFFFAGHGFQVNGRNFLVPVDANITTEQSVRLQAVDADLVIEQMVAARSAVNMVILDACRNNPFERRFRSTSGGLAQINAPQGTLIAYATAPGRVAADGDGANGLYTEELLRAMAEPGLKVEDVFKQARIRVARRSNEQQIPWEASSLVGDFYFTPPRPAPTPAAPVAAPAPQPAPPPLPVADAETVFWLSVQDSKNPDELYAYIKQFPTGRFAGLADLRIQELNRQAALAKPEPKAMASLPPSAEGTKPRSGAARFDGSYTGDFQCELGTSSVAARGNFTMEIRNGQIAYLRGYNPGSPIDGQERLLGSVSDDGRFRLRGEMHGRSLAGQTAGRMITYDITYSGTIGEAGLEGAGNHTATTWTRPCKISARRWAD